MKKLIIINGTMGVGKSTVCKILLDMLEPSVYLDGDWCWNMNPFVVSEENKAMVMNNITHLLKSFLSNSTLEYILFCWVIHQNEIFDQILAPLKGFDFELFKITLTCSEQALKSRLDKDIRNGIRESGVVLRSIEKLTLYHNMDTVKIDVSTATARQAAHNIYEIVRGNDGRRNQWS